jgi:hypothetical protein
MRDIMAYTILCVLALSCGCLDGSDTAEEDKATDDATLNPAPDNVTRGMGPGNMTGGMRPDNMTRGGPLDMPNIIPKYDTDGDGVLSAAEEAAMFKDRGNITGGMGRPRQYGP